MTTNAATDSSSIIEADHTTRNPFAAFMEPQSLMAAHDRMAAQVEQSVIHRPLDKLPAIPRSADDIVTEMGDPTEYGDLSGLGDLTGLVTGFGGFN
jgi:hypothetical protein